LTPTSSIDSSDSSRDSYDELADYIIHLASQNRRQAEALRRIQNPNLQTPQNPPIQMAQQTSHMPISGDRHAPTFDASQPRSLSRYFDNLEELLARAQVVVEQDKKRYALRYVSIDVADQWEVLSTYDAASTFNEWKAEVFTLYPGADSAVRYTRQGLLEYVAQWKRRGFRTIGDWAEFYRNYRTQSTWLINKQKISSIDQNRWCEDAIGSQMHSIATRLQIKLPDTHPGDGYPLAELDNAMRFLLQGTSTALSAPVAAITSTPVAVPIIPTSSTTSPAAVPAIKSEDIGRLLEYFQQLLPRTQQPTASSSTSVPAATSAPPRPTTPTAETCHYCGRQGERLANCQTVEEDVKAGRIMRNFEGRIVLPSGSFVPRSIPGACMRDRVLEWHRRNPNQLAKGSLSYAAVYDDEPSETMLFEVQNGMTYDGHTAQYTYEQESNERIRALEAEIFALRNKRFDGVYVPPPPRSRPRAPTPGPSVRIQTPNDAAPTSTTAPSSEPAVPRSASHPAPESSSTPTTAPASATPAPTRTETSTTPEHPLASVSDATYLPPSNRNVAAPTKGKDASREPVTRAIAPIENTKAVEKVLDRALKERNLAITPEELFAISPDARSRMRHLLTPKRVPGPVSSYSVEEDDATFPSADSLLEQDKLSQGIVNVKDPYETYLRSLPPGVLPKPIRVAKESYALRTVRALVAEQDTVDCILDPGCQIVACSEAVCHELGFSYDPEVRIPMQSANGEVDRALGLARNVPFTIGDMTFYLQVHVIRQAAYDILLGRPFDVLASSIVRNFHNEDQTITLHCPNTNRSITVPTLPRTRPRYRMPERHHEQDF
jgi:hypothetical protein